MLTYPAFLMRKTATTTVQSQLTQKLVDKRMATLKQNLEAAGDDGRLHVAWLNSLQCEEAGKWLEALPLYQRLTIPPRTFRTALRYRLFMRVENMVDGLRCNCARNPVLDARGHHLATGCGVEALRKGTHDALVHELDEI